MKANKSVCEEKKFEKTNLLHWIVKSLVWTLKNCLLQVKCRQFTFEIHDTVPILVEYVDHALNQRILLKLRQGHELFYAQASWSIQIEFLEPACKAA